MKKEKNAAVMSEKLFDLINEVLEGTIDPNVADVVFNGAGKWIAMQKIRVEYKSYKGTIGRIKELEDEVDAKEIEGKNGVRSILKEHLVEDKAK